MYKILHKFAMILANFSILVNTFLTPITVYAQDSTPTETPSEVTETTPAPVEETQTPLAENTPSPTTEPTPEVTVAPTVEPIVEVAPTPEISPEPTTNNPQPTITPEGQVEGTSTETREGTTTIEVTTNEENAHVAAVVIENVEASSVTEEDIVYDGTGTPQLVTDKADYAPTDVVLISGAGFEPNKEYDLVITGTGEFRFDDKVKSDESGGLFYTYQLDGTYRPDYQVEVLDGGSSVSSVTFTDSGPKITAKSHEGQKSDSSWTSGNVTSYKEGDTINFRFNAKVENAPASGKLEVKFSENDGTCLFFQNYFVLGSIENISGTTPAITVDSGPVATSGEWIVTLNISSATNGEGRVNYQLKLSDQAGQCNGSSQHSRLNPAGGDVEQSGQQNVPVPANQVVELPDITVTKMIDRDGNGSFESTASAGEYSFLLDGTTPLNTNSSGQVVFTNVTPNGTHTITESQIDFSQGTYSFISGSGTNCTFTGSTATATVTSGTTPANASCTFNNRLTTGSIIIIKDAQPDNSQDFGFTTTGSGLSGFSLDDDLDGTLSNTKTFTGITAGAYTVSETSTAGWTLGSIVCADPTQNSTSALPTAPTANINLAAGETVTCTFTNTLNRGNIKVNKLLDGDGNGSFETSNPTAFTYTFASTGPYAMGTTQSGFTSGSFSLNENTVTNYHPVGWYNNSGQGSCTNPDGTTLPASIEIVTNQTTEITICNALDTGTITFTKVVTNNYGGSLGVADFPLFIDGNSVTSGTPNTLLANRVYTLTETQQTGYTGGYFTGDDCNAAGSITLLPGDNKSCTITNTDVQPKLTVTKVVINDNGGTKEVTDFPLFVDSTSVKSGAQHGYNAGTYTVSETSDPGYTSSITGDCSSNGSITLSVGDVKSCTITNDDDSPSLTLVKEVTTDNGGQEVAGAWTLTASGPSGFSGSGPSVSNGASFDSGTYDLSESGPSGYTASDWVCVGGSQTDGDTVVVGLGDDVTCTITNDDTAPKLTLIKDPTNDDGGNALPDDFQLTIGGNPATSGTSYTLSANTPYAIDETLVDGYTFVSITGDAKCPAALGGTITLDEGDDITCTITNDDTAPKLKLKKVVINSYNGNAEDADWVLTATGTQGFSDSGDSLDFHTVKANVSYVLSEDGPEGYTAGTWSCGRANLDGNSLTLGLAQEVTCEITNEANPGTLKVKKIVVNDNGGTKVASDFVFQVNGGEETPFLDDGGDELVSERTLTLLNAGEYTVTEPEVAGYETTYENCSKVDLTNGGTETCIITNDDTYGRVNVTKFNDLDGDGKWDEGEEVLSGWDITLGDDTVTTDENGEAVFATVLPAHYVLDEVLQDGWKQTGISCDTSEPTVTPTPTPVDEEVTPTPTPIQSGGICHWNEGADKWNALSVNIDNPGHAGHELDFVYDGPRDVNGHPANDPHNKDNPALNGDAWCEANNPENLTVFDRILNFFGVDDVNAQSDNANTGHPVNVQTGDVINCTIGNKAIPITIELTKTADVTNVSPNSFINYTLEFTNTSEVPVYDVEVKDYTPFEFDYVEGTTKIDGSAASDPSVNGSVLTWSLATVQAGDTITIEYRMQAPSDLAEGKYTNIAVASAYNLDDSSDVTDSGFNIFSLFSVPEVSAATLTPQRVQTYTELATAVVQYARGASFSTGVGGQVLGASTEILPASGSATHILITLLSVLALGVWFKYLARKRLD